MPQPVHPPDAYPLSAPQPNTERLDTVARLTNWVSIVLAAMGVIFALVVFGIRQGQIDGTVLVGLAVLIMAGAAAMLVRTGRIVGGARLIVAGTWIISTAFMLLSGGLGSPAVVGPLFAIALAGILLGDRECVFTAVLVGVTAFVTAWVELGFGLDFFGPLASPWLRAGFMGSYAIAVAVLQITTSRAIQAALESARLANEGLSMAGKIYDATSEGIVVTTSDGTIIDANEAYLRIHGYARADVIGQNPRMMKSDRHKPEFYQHMWQVLLETGRWQGEVWDRHSDGSLIAKWLSMFAVKDDHGVVTHYVGVFSDITAVKQGQDALEWLATHDPLTGLPNRALIADRLNLAVARSRRQLKSAAVLFIDLDHFKDVNDTMGHSAGDRLLVTIAERFTAIVRESDTVGRSGGDEFTMIVSDFLDLEDLGAFAHRVLTTISEPVTLENREVRVTASIGVAVFPTDGADAAELARHADVAMYRAKTLGNDRVEFFSVELQNELEHRVEVEQGLRQAMKENRLFLVYQPQVDLNTGGIIGVEALARWRDTDGSIIMPDGFIPIAESSDLILEIGDFVIRQGCADLRKLHDAGHRLTLAINMSARELMDKDVAPLVMEAVTAAGLEPGDIEVEITESSIMSRVDVVAAKITSLQKHGVNVSIDDFGTGYASMSYVMDFHPSKLKIDRSFVSGLPDDPSAVAIVNATIALAMGIGAKVLAEGPETDAQVNFLRVHGCDIGQGFYFSRGILLEELQELIDQGPFALPE